MGLLWFIRKKCEQCGKRLLKEESELGLHLCTSCEQPERAYEAEREKQLDIQVSLPHFQRVFSGFEVWSDCYVPWPPLDSAEESLKDKIRSSVADLVPKEQERVPFRQAIYAGSATFDPENGLLFNMGVWPRVGRDQECLEFGRLPTVPLPPNTIRFDSGEAEHYYKYSVASEATDLAEKLVLLSVLWVSVPLETVDYLRDSSSVWLIVSRRLGNARWKQGLIPEFGYMVARRFGLSVTIHVSDAQSECTFELKKIFDGICSALHRYTGSNVSVFMDRIPSEFADNKDEVERLFSDQENKVLGDKNTLITRAGQLSPDDDLCHYGRLEFVIGHDARPPSLHIEVLSIVG